jgi:hypothetical protein
MSIKSAIHDSGIPIKIKPFSLDVLDMNKNDDAFYEIESYRMERYFKTCEYVKLHEEFEALYDEIKNVMPECEKILGKIDDVVIGKEVECFEAGYQAGMADLMVTLTFNNLNITQTEVTDFKAINKQGQSRE